MHPLKITIQGDYWDCQLYMGRLYLWTMCGELRVYNWDSIIDSLTNIQSEQLALSCAFTRGSYLYNLYLGRIFQDPDIRNVLKAKFISAGERHYTFTSDEVEKFDGRRQDNPFDSLPTATELYNKRIYAATDTGLYSATAHKSKGNRVSSRPNKLWDCPVLSITANRYPQMALSAGSEGLFEAHMRDDYGDMPRGIGLANDDQVDHDIWRLSNQHSLFSSYAQLSVYSSSPVAGSFLAMFTWKRYEEDGRERYQRVYDRSIRDRRIFGNASDGLSWGGGDRFYRIVDGSVECVEFRNRRDDEDGTMQHFRERSTPRITSIDAPAISAGVAFFGTIIEDRDGLTILLSDGEHYRITGPITRWRIYTRSKNYENHLHVIHDDRIEIYSFNNDYFQDQTVKPFGMTYYDTDFRANRSIMI